MDMWTLNPSMGYHSGYQRRVSSLETGLMLIFFIVIFLVVFAAMLVMSCIVATTLSLVKKPKKIVVECSADQIELIVPNCFYEQEDIQPNATIVGEAYTSDFKTHYSLNEYNYKVVFDNADQYKTFHFDVYFNNDITIGFSDTQEHNDVKIEIVIGGWTGTASVIRSRNESPIDGHVKVYHTKSEFDVFKHNLQVTIADGGVQVFIGDSEPFIEWRSSTIKKSGDV